MLRRRRREIVLGGAAIVVVGVALGGWLAVEASDAKSALEKARTSAQEAKSALQQGDSNSANRHADEAQFQAQQARDAAHSLPWSVAAGIPWLGSPFESGQQITDVVLGLATDVLKPAAQAGAALAPDRLLDGSRVDVGLLRSEQSALIQLSDSANRLNEQAQTISDPRFVSALSDARAQLQGQTADIAALLDNTALAAQLAPAMMGADGPRSYFMGFQTNAEARGTGGLLGGFGVLRFDDGVGKVDDLGPNTELDRPFTPIDLGGEFQQNYGYANPFGDFRNSNLSSHFPYAAQIWKSMWAQQTGMDVDGVIALDPIALSDILGVTGPVVLADGESITKDNVVELTESTAYTRFPNDQAARKQYLQDIASRVVAKMTAFDGSPRGLLTALGNAIGGGHIAVWSAQPDEQALLERTPLAHIIPEDDAPYAEVVINNLGGNKLDYYLEREIEYAADGCAGDTRMSTVTVRLKNTLSDQSLPDYVAGTSGLSADLPVKLSNGSMVTSVRLLGTSGAQLEGVVANGEKATAFIGAERGHPTFEVQVVVPPGTSGELVFRLSEPTVAGKPRVPVQPLVDNVTPVVAVAECAG